MNCSPVIVRELRAEARNPGTFNLRLAGAGILLMCLTFFWLVLPFSPSAGDYVFTRLHLALHLAIWLLVPLATADCISRERRENTLGLLFLTPLSASDIVLAKSLVHGWRALMLCLAVLPVLTVPLLLGGVGWLTIAASVMANGSALCWALAAGLLASAFSKQRGFALPLANLLAVGFLLFSGWCSGVIYSQSLRPDSSLFQKVFQPQELWSETVANGIALQVQFCAGGDSFLARWENHYSPAPAHPFAQVVLLLMAQMSLLALLALNLAVLLAARAIRLNWQEKPPGPAYVWFLRVFCEPMFWRAFFHRWIRRRLEKNPLGWLEQRTWTGRTTVAVWVAIVASFYIAMLDDTSFYRRFNSQVQFVMGEILGLAMAFVAAGSFRRERELGVMELLLVTPLREAELALGRVRGIWEQFIPAIALLLGVWSWITVSFGSPGDWILILFWAVAFASLPVTGLYYSLVQRHTIGALAWTLLVGLLVPLGVARLLLWANDAYMQPKGYDFRAVIWPVVMAWMAVTGFWKWDQLKQALRTRAFPMDVR